MSKSPREPVSVRAVTSPDASTAAAAPASPRLVNIPNALTVLRLVLVPIFVIFLIEGGTEPRIVAFFVFGVASVTDLLDGHMARRSGLITDFGKIADPIADKALTGSALITLSVLGDLAWWVTVVILAREVGVTILRFWVIRHGVIAASRGGKIKTVLQIVAIGLYILPVDIGWAKAAVMFAAVAVTVVTGIDYVARALRLRQVAGGGSAGPAVSRASGTAPSGTAPSGTAPSGTAPSGTAPSGTAPSGTAPSGTAPSGTAPSGTAPSGTAPSGTAPSGTAPSKAGGE
jgi:CDP-diacylglycerol--glycerol-3-phosphate 3-phosphatidyltransferase